MRWTCHGGSWAATAMMGHSTEQVPNKGAGNRDGSRAKSRLVQVWAFPLVWLVLYCSMRGFSDFATIGRLVIQNTEHTEYRILNTEYRIQNTEFCILLIVRVAMIKKPGLVREILHPSLRCPYQWNANAQQTMSRDELLSFFDEWLSFSYHKMQIPPLMPVLNTLCHYDLSNSQNQIKELEKIPGKAAGLTEPMDQHVFNSLLPASWKGEAGKGCCMCTFLWTPSPCSDRLCLLAKTKFSHSCGVTPDETDKYFYPLLTEGTFLIFMQGVAVLQPSSQFLGTKC